MSLDVVKRRSRRVTIAAAVLGAAVVAVVVVLNWGTVRDHVEAWHFQLTRETKTIEPGDGIEAGRLERVLLESIDKLPPIEEQVFRNAATVAGCPVIFDPEEVPSRWRIGGLEPSGGVKGLLEANGWHVLEQRFPRRVYVVIRKRWTRQVLDTLEAKRR